MLIFIFMLLIFLSISTALLHIKRIPHSVSSNCPISAVEINPFLSEAVFVTFQSSAHYYPVITKWVTISDNWEISLHFLIFLPQPGEVTQNFHAHNLILTSNELHIEIGQ